MITNEDTSIMKNFGKTAAHKVLSVQCLFSKICFIISKVNFSTIFYCIKNFHILLEDNRTILAISFVLKYLFWTALCEVSKFVINFNYCIKH